MNTFTIDTDEYYPVCCKENDAKTFKNLVYYFMLADHHACYRLARLTRAFKLLIFSAVYYRVSIERYQTTCAGSFSVLKGRKLYRKYKSVRITQEKEHLLIWNWETTQNLNIYLHNYQREIAIFLATKYEKAIMAGSYLNFSIQKIHQNIKKWWLSWGID